MKKIDIPKRLEIPKSKLLLALSFVPGVPVVILFSMLLTVGIGGGLIGLLIYISSLFNRVPVGFILLLGIGIIIGIFALLYGLCRAFISGTSFEPAIQINLDEEPRLKKFIEEISDAVGTRMPKVVILHSLPEFYVSQGKRRVINGKARGRVLAIGAPLLSILTVDELGAILAHEFGHFYGNDTLYSTFVQPVYRSTSHALSIMQGVIFSDNKSNEDNRAIVSLPLFLPTLLLAFYLKSFDKLNTSISQLREFRSDFIAASIYGKNTMGNALKKVVSYSRTFDVYLQKELEADDFSAQKNLFVGFASQINHMSAEAKEFERVALAAKNNPRSTHPALSERLQSMPEITGKKSGTASGSSLFTNLEKYQTELSKFHLAKIYYQKRRLYCSHLLEKLQNNKAAIGKTFKEITEQKLMSEEEINFCVDVLSEIHGEPKELIYLQFKIISPEARFIQDLYEGRIKVKPKQ